MNNTPELNLGQKEQAVLLRALRNSFNCPPKEMVFPSGNGFVQYPCTEIAASELERLYAESAELAAMKARLADDEKVGRAALHALGAIVKHQYDEPAVKWKAAADTFRAYILDGKDGE